MPLNRSNLPRFEARSLALFASLALGSTLAAAQFSIGPAPLKPEQNVASAQQVATEFKKIDADRNGAISRKEAAPLKGLSRNFDKVDANRDGALSRQEFEQSLK